MFRKKEKEREPLYHSKSGSKRKEEKHVYKLYYIESIERKRETHYI